MAAGSTLPRRALGRQLRKLRERNEISQNGAARIIETSPQTYGRLEEGKVTKTTDLIINALANAFRADDVERRLLLDLAQEIRQAPTSKAGLWRAHADVIPKAFNHFLGLEESASHVVSWQTTLVPGLLQTREYRRALVWAEHPDMPPEEVERVLDLVVKRQELLTNSDFRFDAILSEAVLHYLVGGPGVTSDQFRHLVELSEIPNVSVRIVPFTAKSPVGLLTRSFVMFGFGPLPTSKQIEPPVVYVEGFVGDLYLERDVEVTQYVDVSQKLADVALPEAASRDLLLARINKELGE
ncbi:helix-turn-helix domain-containing protein [Nocardia sp. NBC_00508]|uniref:helix-turn-helix domain-containing protein n=1 Tax=Nocardia sp. NBC_00508 TaxID=2975992 RepID=UPI002E7FB5AE|nr:helix-turn-helix transcriptional regulator [Nocardia sp. NBC_00508]WUD65173.1 helix-turn-helix domain-containing protein [Nocardia sp. NBC_00508]